MARSGVRDPLDKFRWTVSIDGFTKLGFTSVGVPKYAISTKDYAEGGSHLNPRKIVEGISFQPVTLTRGVSNDTSFNKWATGYVDLVQDSKGTESTTDDPIGKVIGAVSDNGAVAVPSDVSTEVGYRKNVKIEHVNRIGQVEVVYYLYNAFPIEYHPASDFDAMADDGVSIETLVLGYEGFEVKYTGISGFAGNLIAKKLL